MNIRDKLLDTVRELETYKHQLTAGIDVPYYIRLLKDAHARIIYLEKENTEMFHRLQSPANQMGQ